MPSSTQTVPLVTVYDYLIGDDGKPIVGAVVSLTLNYPQANFTNPIVGIEPVPVFSNPTDQNGYWQVAVPANVGNPPTLTPLNSLYTVEVVGSARRYQVSVSNVAVPGVGWQSSAIAVTVPAILAPAGQTVGSLTVTGNLTVNGVTTLGNLASLVVAGTSTLTGPVAMGSTLGVTGATTLASLVATTGTFSGALTVSAGGAAITGASTIAGSLHVTTTSALDGDVTAGGRLVFSTAASKIVPGATSLALRNNADSANNLLLTDLGLATLRNALSLPPSAGGALATSAYGSLPVKIAELSGAVGAGGYSFPNIPASFRSLYLQFSLRSTDGTAGLVNHLIRLNNDATNANYRQQNQRTSSTVAIAPTENIGTAPGFNLTMFGGGVAAGFHSAGECWFWNYASTVTSFKVGQYRTVNPQLMTGSGNVTEEYSGLVYQAGLVAVSRIDIIPAAIGFDADSYVALWGYP